LPDTRSMDRTDCWCGRRCDARRISDDGVADRAVAFLSGRVRRARRRPRGGRTLSRPTTCLAPIAGVLSRDCWRGRFGGRGDRWRTILANGRPVTIVGVARQGFAEHPCPRGRRSSFRSRACPGQRDSSRCRAFSRTAGPRGSRCSGDEGQRHGGPGDERPGRNRQQHPASGSERRNGFASFPRDAHSDQRPRRSRGSSSAGGRVCHAARRMCQSPTCCWPGWRAIANRRAARARRQPWPRRAAHADRAYLSIWAGSRGWPSPASSSASCPFTSCQATSRSGAVARRRSNGARGDSDIVDRDRADLRRRAGGAPPAPTSSPRSGWVGAKAPGGIRATLLAAQVALCLVLLSGGILPAKPGQR
jgi:hypothetical protein